jgi:hypothetical protein
MEKDKKSVLIGCMLIGVTMIVWSFFISGGKSTALKNVIVIATVSKLSVTKGDVEVDVQYNYQGKVLSNSFHTANNDSLKTNGKVRLLISQQNPGKDVKYIGIPQ